MMYKSPTILSFLLLLSTVLSGGLLVDTGSSSDPDQGEDAEILTRSALAGSWPVYKGDLQNTGYSETIIQMNKDTRPLWIEQIPYLKQSNTPTIHDNIAYVGSGDGTVRGVDIDSGEIVWSVRPSFKHINTPVTIYDGAVYFAANDGHVYGYDIETKAKKLDVSLNASSMNGAPVLADGKLFIGTMGKFLKNAGFFGIDVSTGNISWHFDMGPEINMYGFKGTPAYLNGRVYIGSGDGFMYCFDADGFEDGNDGYDMEEDTSLGQADIIWRYNATSSVIGSPMIAEGSVVFGNDIGRLFCVGADDGTPLWDMEIGSGEPPSIQTSPSYHDGIVYLGAQRAYGRYNDKKGSSLWAIRLSDSEVLWRFNTTGHMLASSPVLTADAAVFGAGAGNTSVFCVSTVNENIADDDRVLWRVNLGAPIFSAPALAKGRVFIARTDPGGEFGNLYAFGSPDPSVNLIEMSDRDPFIGEMVSIEANILNNATVGADIAIRFMLTNFNNSNQKELTVLEGVRVEAFSETTVSADWVVEEGFDMVVVFIIDVQPKDMDSTNNFGTLELSGKSILEGYWTSSGGGPGRAGSGSRQLESNRTYWTKDLGEQFPGPMEDIWYHGFSGNGTISAAGGALYMTSPEGDLLALNTTPDEDGAGILWRYSNSSVNFMGRPVLLVDQDQSFGGSNKVFACGDDSSVWAFDWAGFRDDINDGPYGSERATGDMDGDVLWRSPVAQLPTQPMFISGANLIAIFGNEVKAFDDDSGSMVWERAFTNEIYAVAADNHDIFLSDGPVLRQLDPVTGEDMNVWDISDITGGTDVEYISLSEELLFFTYNDTITLMDAFPDDNGDGVVDSNDTDEGLPDDGKAYDLIWTTSLGDRIHAPFALSVTNSIVSVPAESSLYLLALQNGTRMGSLSVEQVSGRVISAEDSIYVMTGTGPWTIRAFTISEPGSYIPTWTQTFHSMPRGEPALIGGRMYISLKEGTIHSIGAANKAPEAVITAPADDVLIFPGEVLTLDASGSFDPEGDPLMYMWYLEGSGSSSPLYEGASPVVSVPFEGAGRTRLFLRVYDDMRAFSQKSVNITLLRRITSPDYHDNYNDIHIHMSFGISEPSGAYFINSTVPSKIPDAEGAEFTSYIEFTPLPKYAKYRFEWANISIGYSGKEFPIEVHKEKMGLFMFDGSLGKWSRAPISGVDLESEIVWGNFSDLLPTYYAIGILDNDLPEFRHRTSSMYVVRNNDGHLFRVEYRDRDGNIPRYVKIVIDNDTEYHMELEGVQGNMSRYTFYSVEGISLSPGWHSYYFETDDGFFIIRSGYYTIVVENSPPEPNIIGPDGIIQVREKVQFSGDGTIDPDGDSLSYYWDFDSSDGIDREKVGKVVDKIYYTPGVYIVTLTVSDGTTSVSKNLTVTAVDDDESAKVIWDQYFPLILAGIIAFLFISIVAFIIISRKGHEEQSMMTRDIERGWTCPECDNMVEAGLDECYECGYEYDPIDFEDELDEM
ncbi:MAG: PQQ-binding-like beta-propeller repeat protein [Thermoplasmatota archaeon]